MTGAIDHMEEVDDGSNVAVEIALSAQLVDGKTGEVVWQGNSSKNLKLDHRSVPGVVALMSEGMSAAVGELVTSLQGRLPTVRLQTAREGSESVTIALGFHLQTYLGATQASTSSCLNSQSAQRAHGRADRSTVTIMPSGDRGCRNSRSLLRIGEIFDSHVRLHIGRRPARRRLAPTAVSRPQRCPSSARPMRRNAKVSWRDHMRLEGAPARMPTIARSADSRAPMSPVRRNRSERPRPNRLRDSKYPRITWPRAPETDCPYAEDSPGRRRETPSRMTGAGLRSGQGTRHEFVSQWRQLNARMYIEFSALSEPAAIVSTGAWLAACTLLFPAGSPRRIPPR